MPSEYTKNGIQFQYPDNWKLEEDPTDFECRTISLYNPSGGAFWSVSVHPRSTDLRQLLDAASKAIQNEYQQVECEDLTETLADHTLLGRDMNFYCLDLIIAACVRSLQGDQATYTIFYQAEDREFKKNVPVFQAITTSFLRSIRNLNYWDNKEE